MADVSVVAVAVLLENFRLSCMPETCLEYARRSEAMKEDMAGAAGATRADGAMVT
jgi:hypothetical protein